MELHALWRDFQILVHWNHLLSVKSCSFAISSKDPPYITGGSSKDPPNITGGSEIAFSKITVYEYHKGERGAGSDYVDQAYLKAMHCVGHIN